MRRNAISTAVKDEESEINLTPMLDVVFIMLIFFIVTANFIKEPGQEINRPESDTAEIQENAAILIAVGANDEVYMDGRRIDVRQVKANVVKMLADNPQGSVVIQADERAVADTIIKVMDGAREAGVNAISLASEPKQNMNQVLTAINLVTKPIHDTFVKAFNANKYAAGIGFSSLITLTLFFVMVILIALGDSGLKQDTSVKLQDVVMPERDIDTFMSEVDKPEKPEEQPEDIAQPELDLQPLTGLDVSIAKPKANFKAGGSFFRDGEYIPLFKVVPIYPRRAQERGTMGYALVEFTITETGSVEDANTIEGYCSNSNPSDPSTEFRPCTMFNSASARAALKLKYKPKIVDGKAVPVSGVLHRFTYILDDE